MTPQTITHAKAVATALWLAQLRQPASVAPVVALGPNAFIQPVTPWRIGR